MILAIDPDLFHASEDTACKLVLEKIVEKVRDDKVFEYRFALDGQDIEKEYLDFYEANLNTGKCDNPAFLLLDCIFKNSKYRAITLPPELPDDIRDLIDRHSCITPVEPQLIGMAYYSRNFGGLNLLLAGSNIKCGNAPLRTRGLYNRKSLEAFLQVLKKVQIEFANEFVKVEIPFLQESSIEKEVSEEKDDDPPFRIFLSYARPEDEKGALQIYERLKKEGYEPWFDQESLKSGQQWKYQIEKYIPEADIVIVLVSDKANSKRGYYQKEKKLAIETSLEIPDDDTFLIPVNLDGCDIPRCLKDFHCEDFSQDWERGLNRLFDSIKEQRKKKLERQ